MIKKPYYAENAFTDTIADALNGDQDARNMLIGLACTGVGLIVILLALPDAISRRLGRKKRA